MINLRDNNCITFSLKNAKCVGWELNSLKIMKECTYMYYVSKLDSLTQTTKNHRTSTIFLLSVCHSSGRPYLHMAWILILHKFIRRFITKDNCGKSVHHKFYHYECCEQPWSHNQYFTRVAWKQNILTKLLSFF